MKNSPYKKIKKWENQLNRFWHYSYQCAMKGVLCTYNKKRYEKICRNLDKLIDKHH